MTDNRKLEAGRDWNKHGDNVTGNEEANAVFRGVQADLNFFAEKVGFELVKVDGSLGAKTVAALQATNAAVIKSNPALNGTLIPPNSVEDVATYAMMTRDWLEKTARSALAIGNLRRYHRGTGKEWNVKDAIAYGAGDVHTEFEGLQTDLNHFAEPVGFSPLKVDGMIGARTAAATKSIYDALVKKNPLNAMTMFPVPDTKEECAEYCMFIRSWLGTNAKKLLGEVAV
jgi:lysozyme family protein